MAWFQRKNAEPRTAIAKKSAAQEHEEGGGVTAAAAASGNATPSPMLVRLPRASIQQSPISFTVEETGDQSSKNLWQVYALGGFMIVRWLWARWRERRDARNDEDEDSFGN